MTVRLVAASAVAAACGLNHHAVVQLARAGHIPFVVERCPIERKRRMRFDLAASIAAIVGMSRGRVCPRCQLDQPAEAFRSGGACRACRREDEGATRAARDGSAYRTIGQIRQERAERERIRSEEAADRAADREAAWAAARAERKARGRTLTAEQNRRQVARQRERYATDPEYQARVKAKKIRRKRAIAGTVVEPVNRELVAARDGWRCCICLGLVTRKTWSLDHVVPLSAGGHHVYANVALAHQRCNSSRGTGRLPSQAPLFPAPAP